MEQFKKVSLNQKELADRKSGDNPILIIAILK